jgi:ABC-2 type transport system permease protein
MTVFAHEWRRGRLSLLIWSGAIAFLMAVCVVIWPMMAEQMAAMGDMFAEMGAMSEMFGLDQIGFTRFIDYIALECGEMLGLGGALYAAITAVGTLSGEERGHTAEWLLTHPVSRARVLTEKLLSVLARVVVLNLAVWAVTMLCTVAIGEAVSSELWMLALTNLVLHLEMAAVCFCLSAFLRRGGIGVALGLVLLTYFANLIANLTDELSFLRWITPYSYTDGSAIVANGHPELGYLFLGLGIMVLVLAAAYRRYTTKDIL